MNAVRGECKILIDGEPHILVLTLAALAELETLFGCQNLSDLQTRLKRLSASELMQVLDVLLRAGGSKAAIDRVLPKTAAAAIAEAFNAALG
ncbi:MAG: GTA-gp10 family protein [Pseudomonadota bacterium]